MHPDLPRLLDVQTRDRHLAGLATQLREIDASSAELDAALERIRGEITSTTRMADDASRRRDELERKIEAGRQHQERRRERLEFVRNPKEAANLMGDIEVARGILSQEEGDWVRLSEDASERARMVASVTEKLATAETEQVDARAELTARTGAIRGEVEAARADRDAVANLLDKTLRIRYDRLRGSRKSEVLVPAMKATCTACYTAIPSSRVGRLEADGILLEGCEMCGAIIYVAEVTA